jgi:hypothetical protein
MPMTRKRPSRVSTYVGPPPLAGLAQECCRDLHWFRRADERTRTAFLLRVRVITQALAGGCKSRVFRGVSFPCLAPCCTALRSRWCQSGVKQYSGFPVFAPGTRRPSSRETGSRVSKSAPH